MVFIQVTMAHGLDHTKPLHDICIMHRKVPKLLSTDSLDVWTYQAYHKYTTRVHERKEIVERL